MIFDTVLVGYQLDHTIRALDVCDRIHSWRRARRRILVCNDARLADTLSTRLLRGWEILRGSNVLGEFSGWQEGIDHLGRTGRGVLLANDSITVHVRSTPARRLALSLCLRRADGASVVGFLDRVAGDFAVKGLPLESWVRTNCFGLTPAALDALSYTIFDRPVAAECVNGGLSEPHFFAGLSPDLEHRLCQHLFHGGWYASEPLTARSVERLAFKARCIVLEKWFAARCLALGIELVDPFTTFPWAVQVDKAQSRPVADSIAGLGRLVRRRLRLVGNAKR